MESASPVREFRGAGAASWAGQALTMTAALAIVAKIIGTIIARGLHSNVGDTIVETFDTLSATFAYTLAALLVALVCAASFELARVTRIHVAARASVVGVSGLVVALASPAVVQHLHTYASLALSVTTSLIVLVAGVTTFRAPRTRILGAVLALLAFAALMRTVGWELAMVGAEAPNPRLLDVGRVLATLAVAIHTVALLLSAVWIATRSKLRGRILANVAVVLAFVVTYFAARSSDTPSVTEAVLRASLGDLRGMPEPFGLVSVAAFLLPASILLASAALLQSTEPPVLVASLALALLSHGAFDVPLQALAIAAAAQWTMLAMAEDPKVAPKDQRLGVQQPTSLGLPPTS